MYGSIFFFTKFALHKSPIVTLTYAGIIPLLKINRKTVIFKHTYKADKGSGREFLEKSGCVVEHIQ